MGLFALSRRVIVAPLLVLPAISMAETQANPAERYLNAHEAYSNATCPIALDDIRHFVYFARDRAAIRDHTFLASDRFSGAQIMYAWRDLEPREGVYDFSVIHEDIAYLAGFGKQLFVQVQDATFSPENIPVPDYLMSAAYDGGVTEQYLETGEVEGWVARRWSPAVQARFAALLSALGDAFDGQIAGLNLQESAIGVSNETDPSFSPELYAAGLQQNMRALGTAFPNTTTMQYANFMPGEWLPWEDEGYLRGLYALGEEIGVGLGAPDLLMERRGHLNHALALMHEHDFSAPIGIAIQDGNYVGETNSLRLVNDRNNIVPKLHAFASDFLDVDYLFWRNQQPYFDEDVLTCFENG
ncbi:hypothetical protein [Gymnodinialimonas mytili]|uniref:hypothetical protein n=1 Tax=Gymnodinialimonas mytili TaxID=3126503 RepID=UPI0030EDDDB5